MEAHGVAAEQAFDDLLPPRQDAEDITAGEGRVMEKADLDVGAQGPDEPWRQPEVVVVNPNGSPRGRFIAGRLRKALIDLPEGLPVRVIDLKKAGKAVQDRPDRFLGCDVLKTADLLLTQRNPPETNGNRLLDRQRFIFGPWILVLSPGNPGA